MKLMYTVVASAALLIMIGCTDPKGATRVLKQQGYTNIKMTGYEPMMCSQDDAFSTGFEASNPNKMYVSGSVCSGLTKGYTIRFK